MAGSNGSGRRFAALVVVLALGSASGAAEDTWRRKADMPTERCTFATGVVNGKIYAVGGAKGRTEALRRVPLETVEEYDPRTDSWTRRADMPTARNALAISVVDGKMYAIGGAESVGVPLRTVEEYDPVTDTWTRKADMPTARYALSASAVAGKIYAIGGSQGGLRALSIVEEYDPVTDTWTTKAYMRTARIHLSTGVVDGKIYAIGGTTGAPGHVSLSTVEEYDPFTDTWTRKASMPATGCTLCTSVVAGKIYAIGGATPMPAVAPLSTVQQYDPVTDTWNKKADMPTARSGLSTSAVGGKIYAIGGLGDPTAIALSTVEEYDTGLRVRPPDFNGDGLVDIVDLLRLIQSWDQHDPMVDIAPLPFGDGVVDVLDLELLMSQWEQEVDDPTLRAHWALDESQGPTAYDSAGQTDGTVTGDAAWQPEGGMVGGALLFDGVDDLVLADLILDPDGGAFSILAWVKGGAPGQAIVSQADAKLGRIKYPGCTWLAIDAVGVLTTGLVSAEVTSTGSEVIITDGQWHRVALVWDDSSKTSTLYVDGVEVATYVRPTLTAMHGDLQIGIGRSGEPGTFFTGLIDDVRIYNRAVQP